MSRADIYRVHFNSFGRQLVLAANISEAEAVFERDYRKQFTDLPFVKKVEYVGECVIDDPPPSGLARPQRSEDGQ